MKVLMVNSVCGIRSTGRICLDLAQTIEKNGGECVIAYGRETPSAAAKKYAHRISTSFSVRVDAVKTRLFDNAGFNSRAVTKRFIKWVEEYDPDIVHLHNLHGYYVNIELLFDYLKKSGKPVIWTMHDCWPMTGHCSHFYSASCERWKTGCFGCPRSKSYPSSLLIDNSKGNWLKKNSLFTSIDNMAIITPSKWLAGMAEESFLSKYPIHAIPSGIDLDVFKPSKSDAKEKLGIVDKKMILGAATAWGENKGLSMFCRIADLLGDGYQVVLAGLNEKQIAVLPKNVIGLPKTKTPEELAELYTVADVFVNAGVQETMGLTTVEAMACGTPVVASNTTAVPEVVMACGGVVIGDYAADEFVKCIKHVIAHSDEYTPRANAEKYEKYAQFQKYIEIYKQMIH